MDDLKKTKRDSSRISLNQRWERYYLRKSARKLIRLCMISQRSVKKAYFANTEETIAISTVIKICKGLLKALDVLYKKNGGK